MKKSLLLVLLLAPLMAGAAELTADTPAVEPSIFDAILKAILAALATMLTYVSTHVVPLLNSYLKAHMHFRGAAVVADALTQAITEMTAEVQKALADGTITDAEKAAIKTRAREIAKDKLQRLGGFYKSDLLKWIDEQLEVGLGKILLLAGLKKD